MARAESMRWVVVATAWAIVLAVYLLALRSMPTHVFWAPDEGAKFLQIKAMRIEHGFDYRHPYPGEAIDPELRLYAHDPDLGLRRSLFPLRGTSGGYHFHWPIWFPLLSALPLAIFGTAGLYLIPLLSGWLCAVLSGRLAATIDVRLEPAAVLVVGLATPVFFYSMCFWEHTPAVALGLLAILIFVRRLGSHTGMFAAAAPAVVATLLRLEMAAVLVALFATWCFLSLRSEAATPNPLRSIPARYRWLAAAAVAGLAAALATALPLRHFTKLKRLPRGLVRAFEHPDLLPQLLFDPGGVLGPDPPTGYFAIMIALALTSVLTLLVGRGKLAGSLLIATLVASFGATVALTELRGEYRYLHGLFPIAPFLLLAPTAAPALMRRPREPFFVLTAVGVAYFIAAVFTVIANSAARTGELGQSPEWGARYLLGLYPVLSVLALAGLHLYATSQRPLAVRAPTIALALLLVASGVVMQLDGLREIGTTRRTLALWQKVIEDRSPVVTDIWWLPAGLAEYYYRRPMFVLRAKEHRLQWSELAAKHGIDQFTEITLSPELWREQPFPDYRPMQRRGSLVGAAAIIDYVRR